MRTVGTRVRAVLSVGIGGGSLLLFVYFLLLGAPSPIGIVESDAARLAFDGVLCNVLWTGWIIVGIKLEERDLLVDFGQAYREYQASVPMLMPSPRAVLRRATSARVFFT